MGEVGRWKPYPQRQGQLLPTFVEDGLARSDPVFLVAAAFDLRRLAAAAERPRRERGAPPTRWEPGARPRM